MSKRMAIAVSVLGVLLAGAALWSYSFMVGERAAATTSAEDLVECYRLTPQIEACSKLPAVAADQERIAGETTSLIEQAAKASGIPEKSLLRISPEPAQRLGDSVYKEKPTQVVLKDVSLTQMTQMLHRLASSEQGLYARSLRIAAPREDDTGPTWTAEITVSYLIYEPIRITESGSTK